MDIHQLKGFVAAFKNRSFARASDELNLRQPTISKHVRTLEKEFNCQLFDRLGKTIIPTKEAEILYQHSIELIEGVDALKETIGERERHLTGKLMIGASRTPGVYLLPRIISGFQKEYPTISFETPVSNSEGIVESILKHELFLGIVEATPDDDQIEYTHFIDDELIVISSPSLVKGHRIELRELKKLPLIMREEGSGTRRGVEEFFESEGIPLSRLKVAGIFGSTDAVKQAVKTGLGFSILSRFTVTDELKYNMLKRIELPDVEIKRSYYIVTRKKRTLPKLYDTFFKYLLARRQSLSQIL